MITATQMLESMIAQPRADARRGLRRRERDPRRHGRGHAVGRDRGRHVSRRGGARRWCASRSRSSRASTTSSPRYGRGRQGPRYISDVVGHAACDMAEALGVAAIIVPTVTGESAREVSKHRPRRPIVACTPSHGVQQQLMLDWAVVPLLLEGATGRRVAVAALHRGGAGGRPGRAGRSRRDHVGHERQPRRARPTRSSSRRSSRAGVRRGSQRRMTVLPLLGGAGRAPSEAVRRCRRRAADHCEAASTALASAATALTRRSTRPTLAGPEPRASKERGARQGRRRRGRSLLRAAAVARVVGRVAPAGGPIPRRSQASGTTAASSRQRLGGSATAYGVSPGNT